MVTGHLHFNILQGLVTSDAEDGKIQMKILVCQVRLSYDAFEFPAVVNFMH